MHVVHFIKAQQKIRLISIEIEFLLFINALSYKMEHFLYSLEEDGQKVKGRFIGQELFVLTNQFVR